MVNIIMLSNNDRLNRRFERAFNEFVGNLISFKVTNLNDVYEDIKSAELLLVKPNFEGLDFKRLPKDCAYAWFTKDKNLNDEGSMFYVYLYQNIFEICQSLLKIIENYRNQLVNKSDFFQNTKVISFISCGGKTGATTLAEGFTLNRIHEEKSVLYIVLSPFGKVKFLKDNLKDKDTYLNNIQEVSLISPLELINGFKTLEMALKFNVESLYQIISKAKKKEFDYIIIDTDFNFLNTISDVLKVSSNIALITDGSQNSIEDLEKSYEFINSLNPKYNDKVILIHNQYKGGYTCESTIYNERLITKVNKLPKDFTVNDLSSVTSVISL